VIPGERQQDIGEVSRLSVDLTGGRRHGALGESASLPHRSQFVIPQSLHLETWNGHMGPRPLFLRLREGLEGYRVSSVVPAHSWIVNLLWSL